MAKHRLYNPGDLKYSAKVTLVTQWVIVAICSVFVIGLLLSGCTITALGLFSFTLLTVPFIEGKIKIHWILLSLIKIALLFVTFYSIVLYI